MATVDVCFAGVKRKLLGRADTSVFDPTETSSLIAFSGRLVAISRSSIGCKVLILAIARKA